MLSEVVDEYFVLGDHEENLRRRPATICTDCKSLYDPLESTSSPGGAGDKRISVDLIMIREAVARLGYRYRWIPTKLMVADGLTKDMEQDMLRGLLKEGSYQIHPESVVLEAQRREKDRRKERAALNREKEEQKQKKHAEQAVQRAQKVPYGVNVSPKEWVREMESGTSRKPWQKAMEMASTVLRMPSALAEA